MRLLVVLVVLTTLAVPPASATGATPGSRVDVLHALGVLHEWDDRRARAWARADEPLLRSLYLPGAGAGRADVRLLRSYTARGLVVRRLVTQVFGVRVLRSTSRRITVRVLERVAGGRVDGPGRDEPLPSSPPALRRVELRRLGGSWKVAAVTR